MMCGRTPKASGCRARACTIATAEELIASLKKHPDDLGATIGDWKPQVGAWIRFNPLDGDGVKNENITKFRFAWWSRTRYPLRNRIIRLPQAGTAYRGARSQRRQKPPCHRPRGCGELRRVQKARGVPLRLPGENGVSIDKQNRNPSRLSRMPGVTRNGNRQLPCCDQYRQEVMGGLDGFRGGHLGRTARHGIPRHFQGQSAGTAGGTYHRDSPQRTQDADIRLVQSREVFSSHGTVHRYRGRQALARLSLQERQSPLCEP